MKAVRSPSGIEDFKLALFDLILNILCLLVAPGGADGRCGGLDRQFEGTVGAGRGQGCPQADYRVRPFKGNLRFGIHIEPSCFLQAVLWRGQGQA